MSVHHLLAGFISHGKYGLLRCYFKMFDVFMKFIVSTALVLCDTIVSIKSSVNCIVNIYKPAFLILDGLGCILQLIQNITLRRIASGKLKYKKRSARLRSDILCFRQRCKELNHCESGTHFHYHSNDYTKSY